MHSYKNYFRIMSCLLQNITYQKAPKTADLKGSVKVERLDLRTEISWADLKVLKLASLMDLSWADLKVLNLVDHSESTKEQNLVDQKDSAKVEH